MITKAVVLHSINSMCIGGAALAMGFFTSLPSPLLGMAGAMFYAGREITDLEKQHKWDTETHNEWEWYGPLTTSVLLSILYGVLI